MALVYFVLGCGFLCCISYLRRWARGKGSALAWYHWLGVAIIGLWSLFVAAWVGTSLGEGYAKAAGIGGLIWGGIDLVLFILVRLWIVKTVGKAPGATKPAAAAKA